MKLITAIVSIFTLATASLFCQNEPVIAEAESGLPGADFEILTGGSITYITPQTDYLNTAYPGSADKVMSYNISFSDTGKYELYTKVRIGSGSYSDDSFYAANGFGEKSPTDNAGWLVINNIVNTGYSEPGEVVSGSGSAGILMWKWINVSQFLGGDSPLSFTAESSDSIYIFQFGAREDGLDLDKIAFGKAGLYYTVGNLENGEAGTDTIPGGGTVYPDSSYLRVKTYINPVLPGDHPDPTLLKKGDNFYHCVSSFHFTPYLPVLHSTDLVHWRIISRVVPPDWTGLLNDDPSYGIWQGAVTYFYDSYWIYFSNTAGGGQYFCKANDPEGPWSSPVKMNTTSSTGTIGYDNSVFVDDDGTPYMLIKPGRYVNRIQEIGTDGHLTGEVINMDWINADGQYSWAEGPVMCRRNDWYYYFIAGNVAGGQYVLRSQSLTGDSTQWEAMGNVFASASDPLATLRTPNHMSQPFQIGDGTWWTIAHSYEGVAGDDWNGQGRQGILHQITWDTTGKPTGTAPSSLPAVKPQLPKSAMPWKLPRSDYFDDGTLDLSWHFLNKTAASQYSLTDRPGWLRISPSSGRSHILQRDAGHAYTLVTRVDIDAVETGRSGGIYLTNGNESVNVRLYSGYSSGKKIIFTFNDITYLAENEFGNSVWLKLERKGHTIYGYYSVNGLVWIQVGESINVVDLDKSQSDYNSWVGNSQGLFAEGTQADFDLFIYKDGFSALPVYGYNNYFGVATSVKSAGEVVTNTTGNGGWLMLGGTELGTGEKIPVAVEVIASAISGGSLEIWLDGLENEGTKIATVQITGTGSEDSFQAFNEDISGVSGQRDVYLRFQGDEQAFYLNTIRFIPDESFFSIVNNGNTYDPWLSVYPNPFDHGMIIDIGNREGFYSIFDISGKKLENGTIEGRINNAGISLPPAVYILKVDSGDKNFSMKISKLRQ